MLEENKVGNFTPSPVTEDDQALVEAHWRIINDKMGWPFRFYRVVSKWTQIVQGENIFYHMLADNLIRCEVNFFKSLQGGVDVQVTYGAMGWGSPRSRKSKESAESMTSRYEKSYPNHLDYILVLAETN